MDDGTARQAELDVWRAVASGWERQRALVWEATRAVSERLVELLAPTPGDQLLEIAAGPGDTGLLAAPLIAPGGRLVSTDGVPEMVEIARRRAAEVGATNVDFAVADAAALPLPDRAFDGVLCRFGVMLVPDYGAAARELTRVLRRGGRAAVAVWAEGERNPWITAPGRAALRLGLTERPDPEAPGPFRLAVPGRIRQVLEDVGLTVLVEEEVGVVWRAESLEQWWEAALDTSRSLALLVERLSAAEIEQVRAGAADRLAAYVGGDGSLAVPGVTRVLLAQRP